MSYSANLLLVEQYSISTETRRQKMDDAIVSALSTGLHCCRLILNTFDIYSIFSGENIGGEDRSSHFRKFVETNIVIRDLLLTALHRDLDYQIAAMELYVSMIFIAFRFYYYCKICPGTQSIQQNTCSYGLCQW